MGISYIKSPTLLLSYPWTIYLGDSIYEIYIRRYLLEKGIQKVKELQDEAIKYLVTHSSERFDYIDITNILLFYYQMQSLNNKDIFLEQLTHLRQIYDSNLNQNGIFTFDYQFDVNVSNYANTIQQELSKGKQKSAKIQMIY